VLWARPDLVARAFGSPGLASHSPLLGAVILTWTVAAFIEMVPVARGDVRASTVFIVSSQASKAVFFIGAGLFWGSVRALLYAALAQGVLQSIVLLAYLRSCFPGFWRAFDLRFLRHQASYAVPLGLSALLLRFQLDLPHYFIAHHFGPSVYALYAVGVLNLPLIGLLRESVSSVMLPRVSLLEAQRDPRPILDLLARASRKLALACFPVYALMMVVGREFIVFLFTAQYAGSWPIFAVYLTLLPLGVLVLDPLTRAFARQRHFVLRLRLSLLATAALALWLGTARLGPLGVVTLVVVLQAIAVVASVASLARVMEVRPADLRPFAALLRIGGAAAGAAVAAAAVRNGIAPAAPLTVLLACGAVYAAAYPALLLAFDGLAAEDRALAQRAFGRLRPRGARRPIG
jgi:O-antigen/teichoic acid export membrane protein